MGLTNIEEMKFASLRLPSDELLRMKINFRLF
jgi:hypothetical protein